MSKLKRKKMKKILLALLIMLGLQTQAQITSTVDCDLTGWSINAALEDYVSIYHAGAYLTHPQEYNVIIWEITDAQGNLITQDTIVDDPFYAYYHDITITDTMNVTAHLTNDYAIHEGLPVNCLLEDQLYWEITEIVAPSDLFPLGIYNESWAFVHGNVGVDQNSPLDSCFANPIEGCLGVEIWDPVCGCDGVTYSNSTIAACNSILNSTPGECFPIDNFTCTSNSGIQIIAVGFWENPNDPCDSGECTPNGDFIEIVVDCMEEMGMPCNGEWVQIDGQCCSECLETTFGCEYEGVLYDFGSSVAQDCNSCYCQEGFNSNANGIWTCTEMDCGCEPIYITITSGWNMIGFTCAQDTDAEESFADILDKIIIVKDAVGNAYLPDFGFNGIGDLERGYGYLLKVSEEVTNYNICD
jgi:hypothetical protein